MDYKTGLSTKDKVFMILKKSEGFVSGEEISGELSLSRAAVNAAVKALKAEGCEIESVTRKGYRLLSAKNGLSAGEIAFYLDDNARMENVICLNEIDSTNRLLITLSSENAPSGLIAISNEQTAGRGRLGRAFFSPPESGIYFSYLIKPNLLNRTMQKNSFVMTEQAKPAAVSGHNAPQSNTINTFPDLSSPAAWTSLTSCTAVALANAIENVCGKRPLIKWVNDLYFNGKKICGILTQMDIEPESAHVRSIVIGIGINVNGTEKDFPKELRDIAGSIEGACGERIVRARLAAEMIKEMDAMIKNRRERSKAYLESYRRDSLVIGREITVIAGNNKRKAKALEITDDFSLRVQYADKSTEDLNGGEISIRI